MAALLLLNEFANGKTKFSLALSLSCEGRLSHVDEKN